MITVGNVGHEKEREVKHDSKVCSMSNWKDEVAINENGEGYMGGTDIGKRSGVSIWTYFFEVFSRSLDIRIWSARRKA